MNSKERYAIFLQTPFWLNVRMLCFKRDGFKCKICRRKQNLQAHHTSYPSNWFLTTIDQLVCLCRDCHLKEHQRIDSSSTNAKIENVDVVQKGWYPGIYEGKSIGEIPRTNKEIALLKSNPRTSLQTKASKLRQSHKISKSDYRFLRNKISSLDENSTSTIEELLSKIH